MLHVVLRRVALLDETGSTVMNISLFTRLDGRLGRARWWLGTFVIGLASLVIIWVILRLLKVPAGYQLDPSIDPGERSRYARLFVYAYAASTAMIAYPAVALMKKRLNDRDRPSWLWAVFWAPIIPYIAVTLFEIGTEAADAPLDSTSSALLFVVHAAISIITIWAIVELGFLRGTPGPNRYGPDPLAASE
jgi:uncharacterized membrane protein YhaH (DUF805 family)